MRFAIRNPTPGIVRMARMARWTRAILEEWESCPHCNIFKERLHYYEICMLTRYDWFSKIKINIISTTDYT